MVKELCDATPNGITLLVTGAGGYGKTTLIIAMCNHNSIKNKFANHIIFISLGPQADNPITKLKKLYFDLTGRSIEGDTFSDMKLKFKKIITDCSHDILVVIDDVWRFDDAEPIISTFDSCHVILSSRMRNVSQFVSSAKTINITQMNSDEAVSLLSYNLPAIGMSNIKALRELAEDAHSWPLLLFLIRGQLDHYYNFHNMSCHDVIKCVRHHLYYRGLTAFDKQYTGTSRNHSAKICIESTLRLLSEDDLSRLKSLILFTGIGGLYPKLALHSLWNISKEKADKTADTLCAYGLLSVKRIVLPAYCKVNREQDCVVTHTVLSQYIIDSIMIDEVGKLSPHIFSRMESLILSELTCLFKKCCGVNNLSDFLPKEYLMYTMHQIEHVIIPYHLKVITMHALHDPYLMLLMLQRLQTTIISSKSKDNIITAFSEKIVKLNIECNRLLRESHNSNRFLNKKIEQDLFEKNYDTIMQTLEDYYRTASIGSVALNCIELVAEITPYVESELMASFKLLDEMLLMRTPEYHPVSLEKLPIIKKYISLHKEISATLEIRTDNIWNLYTSLAVDNSLSMELNHITQTYSTTLKQIAPNIEKGLELLNAPT